ncbi:MAG: translation elongation factor Ts [Gemmatimonadota bacterium]
MTITISAKDVAELRARTQAGMMDCKKALEEAGGDMERAAELLRAKGIAKAEKRAGRSTSQGLVVGTSDGSMGALLELTCETDFVARTDGYGAAAEAMLAQLAAAGPMSLEAFLALPAEGESGSNTDRVKAISATTGEGVALKNATKFAPGDSGAVGMYLHHNRQVGVLVEVLCGTPAAARHEAVTGLARELAIHIASANPLAVRAEDLPPALVERERRIATEQVEQEGKPEAIRGKIIDGKVRKFVAEQVLLEQGWVKEEKKPVGQLVTEAAKVVGTSVTVSRFVRFQIGEV